MKQILIADDHEVVRSGLRAIIETRADWVVGGEAIDGRDAVALALKMKPDVAIVDYSMPVMNGLEVSRRIKLHHLHTEVLILTMHESEDILTEVLLAGVRGFPAEIGCEEPPYCGDRSPTWPSTLLHQCCVGEIAS